MLLTEPRVHLDAVARAWGWVAKPEGLCKGDRCVPLPADTVDASGAVEATDLARRLGMGLVVDERRHLWALGPEGDGHVLTTAQAPELELPDMTTGNAFQLSSLRGRKVVLVAWASW